jgi:predicted aspartyl protease
MKYIKMLFGCIVALIFQVDTSAQANHLSFDTLYRLMKEKNFFKAREIYESGKSQLSSSQQSFTEAVLDNAFNQLDESNQKIAQLTKGKSVIPDSLIAELYKIKIDNSVKLYDYASAKKMSQDLLEKYGYLLKEEETDDTKNSLKIWAALAREGRQRVVKKDNTRLQMTKDKAGLNNLHVSAGAATMSFIFDTGANLSTITKSAAKEFNMKIIPVDIEVGTIIGTKVQAQLAVCDKLTLGNIEIHHAVFLVMDDKALAFPQIDYQIHGILGFPVIEGLGEIKISKEGYFIVPKEDTSIQTRSNMAMDGLTPLVYADGMHFTFDTGAGETILYAKYYRDHQQEIDDRYTSTLVSFGGAGGQAKLDGYKISAALNILDKTAALKDISLLKNDIKDREHVYGNIGQDVIRQFDVMTIDFNRMVIRFD